MMMQDITLLSAEPGTYVIVRSDCNVRIENNIITDQEALRIDASMATIQLLCEKGYRVIVISHLGDDGEQSLGPVVEYIQKKYNISCTLVPEITGDTVQQALSAMQNGSYIFLENIRRHPGEMNNDDDFAKDLAHYASVYVNDAFSVSHRQHASIVGLPKYLPAYQGIQFHKEYTYLSQVLNPQHPLVVIMGGAKFGTKLEVMMRLAPVADTICVGGALANTLYKNRGYAIGRSRYEESQSIVELAQQKNIILSSTVITDTKGVQSIEQVADDASIFDIVVNDWESVIAHAKMIVWNGPMGFYEKGYTAGTVDITRMITENKNAITIVGGGDTVTALYDTGLLSSFTFVSLAGGAMLEFLGTGTLPGIEALKK